MALNENLLWTRDRALDAELYGVERELLWTRDRCFDAELTFGVERELLRRYRELALRLTIIKNSLDRF